MLYKVILGILGFLFIIIGMAITLRHWHDFALVFQVFAGPVIAIVGLVMMFSASMKNRQA